MKVELFNSKEDYADVAQWWASQGWPVMPEVVLSPSGFIAKDGEEKIAVTWIFKTNCPIYIMEWTVGNPNSDWEKRSKGIELVTNAACDWAKKDGALQVFTMTKNKRFVEKLQSFGFQQTDDEMIHLVRSL